MNQKDTTSAPGSCVESPHPRNPGGYARYRVDGVVKYDHRIAYERDHGPIPKGMYVDHICWNRACVNPEHLRLTTATQNQANRSGAAAHSKTGVRNVWAKGGGYIAVVRGGGVRRKSRQFPTVTEAAEAASAMRAEMHGAHAGRG